MLKRTAFFDVQDAGGLHFWAGVDEWHTPDGRSRRVDFQRLESWPDCRKFQLKHKVEDRNTGVDLGHRYRETLAKCVQYHWIGYKGSDHDNFVHYVEEKKGAPMVQVFRPWSPMRKEDSMAGASLVGQHVIKGVDTRYARTYLWSNPYFYPILYNLKNGDGRYYGIPSDMPKEYLEQLNSMMPTSEGSKTVWKNTGGKKGNHAWDVACGCLLVATQHGFFKVEDETPSKTKGDRCQRIVS